MPESTAPARPATSPLAENLSDRLGEHMSHLLALAAEFGGQPPTPAAAYAFEKKWPRSCGTLAGT